MEGVKRDEKGEVRAGNIKLGEIENACRYKNGSYEKQKKRKRQTVLESPGQNQGSASYSSVLAGRISGYSGPLAGQVCGAGGGKGTALGVRHDEREREVGNRYS
jgi:hypothetical protein